MGRKIIFLTILLPLLLQSSGCSRFELHLKKEASATKPAVILIGQFDIRNMNYDPYVADEFSDALRFEFFKRGYNSVTIPVDGPILVRESDWAVKTCSENFGDILIMGVISQRESGFLSDKETNTLISFKVYRKDGVIIGEGFYHDKKSAGEESLRRDAADKFVTELMKSFD
jgi:hypothetical protein